MMNANEKELWIDLKTLTSSCFYENDKLVIYYQYDEKYPEPLHDPTTYLLRKALRSLGHSIERYSTFLGGDLKCRMKTYYTTVTKQEGEVASKLYNEWISEVCDDE